MPHLKPNSFSSIEGEQIAIPSRICYAVCMTKFERITAALEALPDARREEIADILETLFYGDLHPHDYQLSDDQVSDLKSRLANPGPIASEEEVEAFFKRFA